MSGVDATAAAAQTVTEFATSSDGTRIAFERTGTGPALLIVDGLMCSRALGPSKPFTAALRDSYSVVSYDRRGRGESGGAGTTGLDLEIADLRAVVEAIDETPFVLGFSSGAGLTYRAAAAGVPMRRILGYETPWVGRTTEKDGTPRDYLRDLEALLAAGRPDKTIDYFMTKMIDVPWFVPLMMRLNRTTWATIKRVAPTIPNDVRVMGPLFEVPVTELGSVDVPTLVVCGSKAAPAMLAAQETIAAAIPGAQHRILPGQTHNVVPRALAPLIREFLR